MESIETRAQNIKFAFPTATVINAEFTKSDNSILVLVRALVVILVFLVTSIRFD